MLAGHLDELVEYPFEVGARNPHPGVLHRDLEQLPGRRRRHEHLALGRVLDGVADQVAHDLDELALVGDERRELGLR